jgi:Carboxypeptidase regulatory-like domain/TonB-dependent Receptor Plug Domain
MWNKFCGVGIVAIVFALLPNVVTGQVTTGTILGSVHDSTGAAVPGAKITITDNSKGTATTYQTDDSGFYNAEFLIPGTYNLSVEKEGFKRAESHNIILDVDQKARVDVTLEIGQVNQTLEVTAAAPLVRSESAELGEVIAEKQVQNLPLNGRNFAQLVTLVPGVTAGQPGENLSGSSSFNPRASSDFNALGSQANTNGWLIDGIDDNEWTFNTVMVQPSVESVAEFKVLTGTFSAEFGRGAGVVSVSTRSGSNAFHGEAFEYLRNSFMDARNYFNPTTQVQPEYRRNQFGGALAGRIIPDKLFFFADYYGQRSLKGIVNLNSVPTAAERVGDFSNYRNAAGQLITIYDPYTGVASGKSVARIPLPGNIIPASQLNPVGLNVASIYPLPMGAGSFNNFTSSANQVIDDNGGNTRLDYRLSDKDSMFFRYSFEQFLQTAPNPLVGGSGTCCLPTPSFASGRFDLGPYVAGIQNTTLAAQGAAFNETHLFSPTLLNEYRMGYSRTNPFTFQSDYGHKSATSLGIQGLNVSQFATGLPNIQIGNSCGAEFTCLQGGTAFLPAHPRQTNIQFEDTVSWTRGTHQMKFGFRYIRELASPFTNTTTRGQLTFNDNFTNNPLDPQGVTTGPNGSGLAALLFGFPNSGSRNYLQTPYYITNGEWAGFFQDDWKVNSRLTLNLGLRYDVFTPDTEIRNRLANFNWNTLSYVYAGVNGVGPSAGIQTRYGNLGPRFGFAYDVSGSGKTILRGGYGIVYFPDPFSASDELGQQPPFTVSQTFSSPATYPPGSAFIPCTTSTTGCLAVINNPFPQGVTTVPPSVTTNTATLNAAAPAIIGHEAKNLTPYMESWNLDIERQLTSSSMLEVAYAGSRGIHLTYAYNPDEIQPGTGSQASRRLIQPLNNVSTWVQLDERNMSNFHSLQVKYTKRYQYGLTALLSYTWGRSLDYGGSAASGGGATGNPQTVTNLKAGYGLSGFDQQHRFVGNFTYELPFGAGRTWLKNGFASYIVGGWELDGIVTLATGLPFTVYLNSGVNNGAPSWPNRIGSGVLAHQDPAHWFDTSAFVAPPPNTYGNSGRGILYGPGTSNWDLSVQRQFRLIERATLRFRLDAFNSFNTPNFGEPNANIGSPTAGQITSTVLDNRDLQASATIVF